ncbi:MAG: hypothetical protein ACQEWV_24440 [Bacillota bacterium]
MSNQTRDNEKQKSKSLNNRQGSGAEYHREHAGNVEGYGETYPYAKGSSNMTENTDQ